MMRIFTETPYEVRSKQYQEQAAAYIEHEKLVTKAKLAHGEHPHLDLLAWMSRLEQGIFHGARQVADFTHQFVQGVLHGLHQVADLINQFVKWMVDLFSGPHFPGHGGKIS